MNGISMRRKLWVLPFALGAALPQAAETVAAAPPKTLQECAAINEPGERFACYDRLAGRAPATQATLPIAPPAATAPTASSPTQPPAAPKGSFGLYNAEHPAALKVEPSHTAKVAVLGSNANNKMTVSFDSGEVWELASADPLLAAGDTVTIKRATFGAFLMTTPSGRIHRARRLR
jgi:hypothetical protein